MSTHSVAKLVSDLEQADLRDPLQRGLLLENLERLRSDHPGEADDLAGCIEAATLLARFACQASEDAVVAELQRLIRRILVLVEYLSEAPAQPSASSAAPAEAPDGHPELNGMLLAEILLQFGLLESDDARRVARACQDEGRLGEQLLELGLVSAQDLQAALQFHARLRGEELPAEEHPAHEHAADGCRVAEPQRPAGSRSLVKERLGEILVKRGVVSAADLDRAILTQKREGRLLGETLISMRLASPRDVARALRDQAGPT